MIFLSPFLFVCVVAILCSIYNKKHIVTKIFQFRVLDILFLLLSSSSMAVKCFYLFNSRLIHNTSFPLSYTSNLLPSNFTTTIKTKRERKGRRTNTSSFVVLSTHSNPRILKPNRRSRYGQTLSPYDSDDDHDDNDEDDDSEDDDDISSDDEFDEVEDSDAKSHSFHLAKNTRNRQGGRRELKNRLQERSSYNGQTNRTAVKQLDASVGMHTPAKRSYGDSFHASNRLVEMRSVDSARGRKMKTAKSKGSKFDQVSEELDLDEKWYPLLDYLTTFGLKESHFMQIYERHMPSLQINVASAKERLEFLMSVGVKQRDIKKILLRQPQILGYTVENNMKSHVAFLVDIGIPESRIGHIITAAPSLFSYSVEQSLKPTTRYLVEEVGIKSHDLSKVVQLSPQILVQRIDNSWNTRFCFLSKELGAPRDNIVKMVKKHPQLLHYSIEDGILPRINFLRSIGMRNPEIVKVLTSLTQVLSLSLEDNLKPKYLYLVNELRNEVHSLTKYPTYLSLSLDQRIRPRHRFLVSLKKAPKGPFPLSSFVPTDESFCQQWGTSLDKYLTFRQNLLLKEFANKYQRKG